MIKELDFNYKILNNISILTKQIQSIAVELNDCKY